MYDFVLFLHMASAASWIGGAMLLFILGITLRDKEVQKKVYYHIGPPYGYFESVVLVILWVTGIYMYMTNGFHDNPERFVGTQLGTIMHIKIALVILITLATIVHMKVSLEANGREKSTKEKFLARGTSMMIFLLNFVILWLAMQVRDVL